MINEANIKQFKDLHKGKRLFILASGPSLGDLDLSKLERRITMGLNRSFLIYPETHYHCTMDKRLFDLYAEEHRSRRYIFTIPTCPFGISLELLGAEGFSFDLEKGIYSGYTISYFALQMALYMGFSEVYYLGLDLKNQSNKTHFFGQDYHSQNHDNSEYPRMIKMLDYAANLLREHDVKVFNCSPVSKLESIPYIDFEYAVSL